MKKRTVITTEKREVWIIRREDGAPEIMDETLMDVVSDEADPRVADEDGPDQALIKEKGSDC